jgi:hypothetical protein
VEGVLVAQSGPAVVRVEAPAEAIDPEWRAAFDAARPLVAFERMLDFHCPRRTAPVRIVYEQMSDLSKIFDCDLLEVLEATSWPKP